MVVFLASSQQFWKEQGKKITEISESVKCHFSKCRFSVLNLKFDFISDGGCTRGKQIQKALGSLPPCGNRCRFSESAICSSRVRPPSEIKSNFKFKTLRWRPLRWRLTLSNILPASWGNNGASPRGQSTRVRGPLSRYTCRATHVSQQLSSESLGFSGATLANAPACYSALEPRNPKVHFKVRKMPFWTPRKNGPQSPFKCPKNVLFWGHLNVSRLCSRLGRFQV